jgi:hypothetical protein
LIDLQQLCPVANGKTTPEEPNSFDTCESAQMSWTYDAAASTPPMLWNSELGYHSSHTTCDGSSTGIDNALSSCTTLPVPPCLGMEASTMPIAMCYDTEVSRINEDQSWLGCPDDSLRTLSTPGYWPCLS